MCISKKPERFVSPLSLEGYSLACWDIRINVGDGIINAVKAHTDSFGFQCINRLQSGKLYFQILQLNSFTLIYHKYVNYDHPGECSPEKDCLW